jgi:hypothetical protein
MDLNQYTQDAIRTESRIENITVNTISLMQIMKTFIAAGTLLDMVKKNVFYNKPIELEKWNNQTSTIQDQVEFGIQMIDYVGFDGTEINTLNIDPRVFHAIVGIATESTELVEAIVKSVENGVEIDKVNVAEECGDLHWYESILMDATHPIWDNIFKTNIAKLKKRYPEKFTSEAAIHRDIEAERKILES